MKTISHRARLTLAAAGSATVVLLVIFAIAIAGLQRSQRRSARDELRAALNQVAGDYASGEVKADLAEIVSANPYLSLAIFDQNGQLLDHAGPLTLRDNGEWSGAQDAITKRSILATRTVVAGVTWQRHADLLQRFELLCAAIMVPLVALVALTTWLTARSTFLPLQRLATEAETISTEDLGKRLQLESSREYGNVVASLNRLLDRVETSVKREERFIQDAAHELRTPLTILRGQIEALLLRDRPLQEYRDTSRVLLDELRRLSILVELLLRSARQDENSAESTDIAQAVELAHSRWVDRYAEKGVRLNIQSEGIRACIGEMELGIVLENLLSNALRASESGSTCAIESKAVGGSAHVTVQDEGTGIAEGDYERIFERLARSDEGRNRSSGGFGIGLSLCQRIVSATGGRMWAEPNEPKGARFHVEIPLA